MAKPDLTHVRPLTPAELAERRAEREGLIPKPKRRKGKRRNKHGVRQQGRTVVVASVSIRPELKVTAERYLGNGNFSRAVTLALTKTLQEYMDEQARTFKAQNRRRPVDNEWRRILGLIGRDPEGGD